MSTKLDSLVTKRHSIILRYCAGRKLRLISASHRSFCQGATGAWDQNNQQAIASAKISANLPVRQTALAKLLKQRALALEAGVGRDQSAADATHRACDHFIPKSARALGGITPKLIKTADTP
jgi:hypothetical protein